MMLEVRARSPRQCMNPDEYPNVSITQDISNRLMKWLEDQEIGSRWADLIPHIFRAGKTSDENAYDWKAAKKYAAAWVPTGRLQSTVPSPIWALLQAWARVEGRNTADVANFAMETGIRKLMAEGVLPKKAIEAYEETCLDMSSLAEICEILDGAEPL